MRRSPLTTVLILIVLGVTALTILCYATIYLSPNIFFNPLSPERATVAAQTRIARIPIPTAIPTATLEQVYPPTWTPTFTPTPAPTRTPTDTRTPTPTRTSTPSRTPTPTLTFTPLPPTPTPTETGTATPFPFAMISHGGENNCANMGLRGTVYGPDGLPARGINIQYGELGVPGSNFVTTTDANGRYVALLLPGTNRQAAERSHDWYAYVINSNGVRLSQEFRFTTDPLYADNPGYCYAEEDDDDDEDAEANDDDDEDPDDDDESDDDDGEDTDDDESDDEDTTPLEGSELPAGCLLDPCRSEFSINVKVINWQFVPIGPY